jgi:hypothetical protein
MQAGNVPHARLAADAHCSPAAPLGRSRTTDIPTKRHSDSDSPYPAVLAGDRTDDRRRDVGGVEREQGDAVQARETVSPGEECGQKDSSKGPGQR